MKMQKAIHRSWNELAKGTADRGAELVRFDFSGTFTQGSYEGTAFAGRIDYDPSVSPTDLQGSFAIYEAWPGPVVTIAVGGQVLTAQGAAVYDSVYDGCDSHFDFVNMFGTGPFDRQEDAAFFEVLFADDTGSALDGTQMPTARQLRDMPVKQVSFGTQERGNFISRGDFTLRPAA
jgi:hypothetical protein